MFFLLAKVDAKKPDSYWHKEFFGGWATVEGKQTARFARITSTGFNQGEITVLAMFFMGYEYAQKEARRHQELYKETVNEDILFEIIPFASIQTWLSMEYPNKPK